MRIEVALACALIATAAPAVAETVELVNGDRVSGEVVESTDAHVVVESPVLGRIVIPREQIAIEEPDAGAFGWGLLRGWKRRFALGASGASGNTEKAALSAALDLAQEDADGRWKFAASYFWGSSNGDEDTNKAFVDLERDWTLADSQFYLFGRAGYDYDGFRPFGHRVDGSAGLGYWWLDGGRWRLGSRLGAGVSYTWSGESEVRPEASLGIDSVWRITEGHSFEIHSDIYLDLDGAEDFRTHSTADWNFDITELLGLNIGVIHDYVSDTQRKKSDLTYRGAVTVDF